MRNPTQLNYWPSFIDLILMMLFMMVMILVMFSRKVLLPESLKRHQRTMLQDVLLASGKSPSQCERLYEVCAIDTDKKAGADLFVMSERKGAQVYNFSDQILFDSGTAYLSPDGMETLRRVGGVWRKNEGLYEEIRVEGHTDIRNIETKRYPSNWHLGAARAVAVTNFLQDDVGISPYQGLSASSYGRYRPARLGHGEPTSETVVNAENATEALMAKNRRIEVVLKIKP